MQAARRAAGVPRPPGGHPHVDAAHGPTIPHHAPTRRVDTRALGADMPHLRASGTLRERPPGRSDRPAGYNPRMRPSLAEVPASRAWNPCPLRAAAWVASLTGLLLVPTLTLAQDPGQVPAPPVAASDAAAAQPRLSMGADLTITVGPEDPYYFNYTDYYQNALRLFIGSVGASYSLATWLDAVGEVRIENDDRVKVSALYARLRPWQARPLTVSAGRVPPVFGAFARTRYGSEQPPHLATAGLPVLLDPALRPRASVHRCPARGPRARLAGRPIRAPVRRRGPRTRRLRPAGRPLARPRRHLRQRAFRSCRRAGGTPAWLRTWCPAGSRSRAASP